MSEGRRLLAFTAAASLSLALSGCGGGGGVTETCVPPKTGTPPNCRCPAGTLDPDCRIDCTQTNVYQNTGPVPRSSVAFLDFSVPDTGRLDVTMDWTNASSPVGFFLVPANTCTTVAEFNARSCNFIIRSEPSTQKPRKISQPNLAAGNYRWLIANFANSDESVALQIILSKGTGCPALTGVPPTVQSRADQATPAVGRMERQPY